MNRDMTMDEMKRLYRAKQEQIRKARGGAHRGHKTRRSNPKARGERSGGGSDLCRRAAHVGESGADPSTSGGEIASSFLIVRSHVVPRSAAYGPGQAETECQHFFLLPSCTQSSASRAQFQGLLGPLGT
jgi:hypothetical protein